MTGGTIPTSGWSQQRPEAGDVHVWWMPVADDGVAEAELEATLDDAERARVERLRFDRDRGLYVRRHAFARRVLARYLDVPPAEVPIGHPASGRPELDPSTGLSFSMSHAGPLTVVGVTGGGRLGIDIERVRAIDEALDIAERTFTEREAAALRAIPLDARPHAFLSLWTRKESFVKAVGRGLSMGLAGFDVLEHDPQGMGQPRGRHGPLPYVVGWLDSPPGYVGAVALAGERLVIWRANLEGAA